MTTHEITRLATPCRVAPAQLGTHNGLGYVLVAKGPWFVRRDGRRRRQQVRLHRWVVEQIEGVSLAPGEVVMHLCDNPPCFRYDHLRRATQAENWADMRAKGRQARGERNHSKLTAEDVVTIRSLAGVQEQREIAAHYSVAQSLISSIINRKKWTHLP